MLHSGPAGRLHVRPALAATRDRTPHDHWRPSNHAGASFATAPPMSFENGQEGQHTRLLLDIVQRLGIVEGQNAMIIEAEGRAADGRGKIYDIVTEINDRIDGVDLKLQKIDALEEEVDRLKADAAELLRFRDRLRTVLWVITPVGTVILVTVGAILKDAWTHLREWFWR